MNRSPGTGLPGAAVTDHGHVPDGGDHEPEAEPGLVYRKPDAEECREECSS